MAESRGRFQRSLIFAMPLLLMACSIEPKEPGPFYQASHEQLYGPPGTILRSEEISGAPTDARAWRVLYRSTGLNGEPIPVSGVIIAPRAASQVPRKVVAWAHPTTGVTSRCAPSLQRDFFKDIPGLIGFIERGYVVAATDYQGLGTPGAHPYLVGISEARSVLDAVRAAVELDDVQAAPDFAVWGHSQGGHAALFVSQEAEEYAPDLHLAGVAAAAPPTDLASLLEHDLATRPGKVMTALAVWSWNKVYDALMTGLLDSSAIQAMNRMAQDCLEGEVEAFVVAREERAIDHDFLQHDLTDVEPWRTLLARNSPQAEPNAAPLFISQGAADTLVLPETTLDYAKAACRQSTPVRFLLAQGAGHLEITSHSQKQAVAWIADRFDSLPPPNDCNNLPSPNSLSG